MSRLISARSLLLVIVTLVTVVAGGWLTASAGRAAGADRQNVCHVPAAARPAVDERAGCIVDEQPEHRCCNSQPAPQAIAVAAEALFSRSAPVPLGIVLDDWPSSGRQLLPELTPPRTSSQA